MKIKYKICDISPILISPRMSHSNFTRAEIEEWAPSTTKANTSSDCVVLSSCRDPCRLTTVYIEYISNHNIGYRGCWRVWVETRPGEAEEALTAVGRLLPRCLLYGIDEYTMGRYMDSGCSPISSNSSGHFKRRVHFDSRRRFHSPREKRNGSERVYVFVASRDITDIQNNTFLLLHMQEGSLYTFCKRFNCKLR